MIDKGLRVRKGFFTAGQAQGDNISPGTSTTGGTRSNQPGPGNIHGDGGGTTPFTYIGGKKFDVTPETRAERKRAELKRQLLAQTKLGGNKIDKFGNTIGGGLGGRGRGIGGLIMGAIGALMGLPGLGFITGGIRNFGDKFKDFEKLMRGTNLDGSVRTQEEYEQARYDKQQQNRLDKLFEAKDRGYNTLTPFGKFKTTDFTAGQQAKIDELLALGYEPSTARDVLTGRDLANNTNVLGSSTARIGPTIFNTSFDKFPTPIGPQSVNVPSAGIETIDVGYQDPAFENALLAGLTEKQKQLLDQRKGMLGALGDQGILDTIKSEDDPNDPATLQDVRSYYGIV